jgi:hypothetical protein
MQFPLGLLDAENEGNMTVRNVGNYSSNSTVSHPGRRETFVLNECGISLLYNILIQLRLVGLFIILK